MFRHTSRRTRRLLAVAAAGVVAAGLALIPLQANAAAGDTDLSHQIVGFTSAGGGSGRVTARVFNNGPSSVDFGDFAVKFEWGPGVSLHSSETCQLIGDRACVKDSGPIPFFEDDPFGTPRFVDTSVRFVGNAQDVGVFVSTVAQNYSELTFQSPELILISLPT